MQIGMIGLGKMGANMVRKLCRADIHVVGFDSDGKSVDALINDYQAGQLAQLGESL